MCPVFNLLTNIDIHHCFVEFAALPGYTAVTTCVNVSSQDERSPLQPLWFTIAIDASVFKLDSNCGTGLRENRWTLLQCESETNS